MVSKTRCRTDLSGGDSLDVERANQRRYDPQANRLVPLWHYEAKPEKPGMTPRATLPDDPTVQDGNRRGPPPSIPGSGRWRDRSALRPSESPPKAPPSPRQTPQNPPSKPARFGARREFTRPQLPGPADDLGSPGSPHGVPLSHRHGWGLRMSLSQVEDDRPRTGPASISPWPWWPASSRADGTKPARLEALVRPRTAAGSRAAEPQRTPVADSVWRTWTRSSTRSPAASTHPDPATLLDISTTACRRMRSAPAPVQTWSPALLLGLHVFSALGGDGLGRSQA
jgi:hypothetical protein